jgi:hypothetical protein
VKSSVRSKASFQLPDDVGEMPHPVDALVLHVPDQPEPLAGPQDAVDLRKSGIAVEPVKGLTDGDRVHRRVLERDALGSARERLHFGKRFGEPLSHRIDRLDSDDLRPELREEARELPRAGGKVEHPASREDAHLADKSTDGDKRVNGPTALVSLRDEREAARGRLVDDAPHPGTS